MRGRPKKYFTEEERKVEIKERYRKWYDKNRNELREKARIYKRKNKDKINRKAKEWRENNKDKTREYSKRYLAKDKRKRDSLARFKSNTRSLICQSFKRNKMNKCKKLRSEEILGCSLDEFRDYILEQYPKDITLDNFGNGGYHIDHIIPLSTATTEEDIINLCHYTNLQPLWWEYNLKKSNNINF